MKPENQLLLMSSRLQLDDQTKRSINEILSGTYHPSTLTYNPVCQAAPQNSKFKNLDWPYILESANRSGISPIMYKHLSRPDWRKYVPIYAHQELKAAYQKSAFQSLRIRAQIEKLNQAAADRHIPLIFLKGAALSGWLYEDMALRPMSDIDVLIKDEDIPRMKRMLVSLGYHQDIKVYQTEMLEAFSVEWDHMPAFHLDNGVNVEVHTNIFGAYRNKKSTKRLLWETAIKVQTKGISCYRLSNEYFLLHLCLHLGNHARTGGIRLYWICDILQFLSETDAFLEWDLFNSLSLELGAQYDVAQIFSTIAHFFVTSYTSANHYFPKLGPMYLDFFGQYEGERPTGQQNYLFLLKSFVKNFYMLNGLGYTIYTLLRLCFPPKQYMNFLYPEGSQNWPRCYAKHIYNRLKKIVGSYYFVQ